MANLFYQTNWFKHQKRSGIVSLYMALLSMLVCMVCLIGTSWAWFTASQRVDIATIVTAEWAIDSVEVYQIENDSKQKPVDIKKNENGISFKAAANTEYQVKVVIKGNTTNGYLLIETCDGEFYTTANSISFRMILSDSDTVEISTSWGIYEGTANRLTDSEMIGKGEVKPQEPEPTAEPEANESEVAEPEVPEPEVPEPEVPESEVPESEVPEPEVPESEEATVPSESTNIEESESTSENELEEMSVINEIESSEEIPEK